MRTIKFRAFDTDNKIMHFQSSQEDDVVWNMQPTIRFLELGTFDSFPGGQYHEQKEEWFAPNQVLMQFTNRLDKNGKECFEGDRIAQGKVVYTVSWNIEKAGFYPFVCDELTEDGWEVLGNIYENPELLKS